MRRTLPALVALCLAFSATASSEPAHAAATPRAGQLRLKVSTHSGPMPLELTLTARLAGLDPAAGQCFIRWDRVYRSPGGQVTNQREETPCPLLSQVEPASRKDPGLSFETSLMLKEPGDYSLRIVYKSAEGRQVAGTSQEVKVYRGHVEASMTRTHQDD